nr:hypothetical protein [uncultured Desulfobacter sp.]
MSTIRPEDLGDMGESFFKSLCKSIGLIANKSDDDKAGWDYEVEHPKNRAINYANQSYPVYRIQVKSSASKGKAVSITYSNLLNLIQYPGASFIVLLKYATSGLSPTKCYLKHISQDFSSEILKKLRKKELKNTSFSINKNKTKIIFGDDEELTPLTGSELIKIFQESIGQRYLTYIDSKVKYLEKLEKEGKTKIFETTFKSEKDFKDMIDTLLGYDKKFFMDVEEFNAPFGIKDATPISTFKKHRTNFNPIVEELTTAKIYLKNSKYGSQYKFDGTIYTPPLKLPKEYEKMRIKTALFDLIFSPDQGQLKFDTEDPFRNDKKVKFKELYTRCSSFLNLTAKQSLIRIRLLFFGSAPKMEMASFEEKYGCSYVL